MGTLVAGMKDEDKAATIANLHESKILTLNEVNSNDNVRLLSFNARSINNKFSKIREITSKSVTTDYSISGYHKPEFKVYQYEKGRV